MMDPRLTHAALQTRITKIRADAHDRDQSRMRWELDALVSALSEHLAVETTALAGLPGAAARAVRDGQVEILSTLTALVRSAKDIDYRDCESLAGQLDALLQHQDVVERRAFRKHDSRDRRRGGNARRAVGADATRS